MKKLSWYSKIWNFITETKILQQDQEILQQDQKISGLKDYLSEDLIQYILNLYIDFNTWIKLEKLYQINFKLQYHFNIVDEKNYFTRPFTKPKTTFLFDHMIK